MTAYPSGLTRVSQPPDPRLAWGQTPQFRQRSWADDSRPEGLCSTVLTPLDRPILSMIGTGKFRRFGCCGQTLRAGPTTSGIIPCLFARLPARDNVAGPLERTASPADDNSGVSNHLRIVRRHRRWLLTAYPSGLTRVSQPPDPHLAWGQTPQFRQRSWADASRPEGLCPTVLAPLDRPIRSIIGTGKFRHGDHTTGQTHTIYDRDWEIQALWILRTDTQSRTHHEWYHTLFVCRTAGT